VGGRGVQFGPEGVDGEQWFNIGQLTDVSGCKLQKYF
jgi:hypothetical protein